VYTLIGSRDHRVGTERCVAFYAKLFEAEAAANVRASAHELHVINDQPGHAVPEHYYQDLPRWLLRRIGAAAPQAVESTLP
jgi:hypothetical protein